MAYSEKVLDHYENPRNVGSLDKGAHNVGTGMVGAPACGDVMRLQIRVNQQGVIEDAKFKTYGCGSAIASSSLLTEWVKGKTLDQALQIKNSQIAEDSPCPRSRSTARCWPRMRSRPRSAIMPASRRATRAECGFCPGRLSGGLPMSITLTQAAAERVTKFLAKRGKGVGLRLGVRTSGCSGMAYVLEFVDEIAQDDQVFEDKGVRVIVDPKSLMYLDGTELDYGREGLNEGFKFNNPNVKDQCGCGESFNV